jgi:hypothetical protein
MPIPTFFGALLAGAALSLATSVVMPSAAQASVLALASDAVQISARSETGSRKPRKTKAAKKSKGGNVSFHDGSAESRSERDRRLTRECRGRSNSGLCEGYTR